MILFKQIKEPDLGDSATNTLQEHNQKTGANKALHALDFCRKYLCSTISTFQQDFAAVFWTVLLQRALKETYGFIELTLESKLGFH